MTLPLALRRRWPLATVLVVLAAAALQELLTTPPDGLSMVIAVLVASYSVAAYSERWSAAAGLVAAILLVLPNGAGDAAFALVLIGGAWGAGRLVRRQNLLLGALAREQAARERAAIADERARLAPSSTTSLHTASPRWSCRPRRASRYSRAIRSGQREAFVSISEFRAPGARRAAAMLGLLRSADGERALGPQPGLAQLQALVEEMRDIGLPVELTIEGQTRPLPAGVDLSAYRIVQEALTNTLKHARPARARVTVRYRTDDVELEVLDDGRRSTNGSQGGHGIAGMRERVRLYGGTLETGRRDDGGFTVRARLPAGTA